MTDAPTMSAKIELLRKIYAAFNRREIETVLAVMHPDVDWPNGMEGGRVLGTDAVREYWKRQFSMINARVDPETFSTDADGRIAIGVHQVVRDNDGKLLADQMIRHIYDFQDGRIRSMEIQS
jgi:ketosteroid isomerase-like protein